MRITIYCDFSVSPPKYLLNMPYGESQDLKRRTVILPDGFRLEKAVYAQTRRVRRHIITPDGIKVRDFGSTGHSNLPSIEWLPEPGKRVFSRVALPILLPETLQRVMVYRYCDTTGVGKSYYWSADPGESKDGVFQKNSAIVYLPEGLRLCRDVESGEMYFEVQVDPVVREHLTTSKKGDPYYKFAPRFTEADEDENLVFELPSYIPGFHLYKQDGRTMLPCYRAEPMDIWEKPPAAGERVDPRGFVETVKYGPGSTTVLERTYTQ